MQKISLEEAKNLQPYVRTPLSKDPDFYTVEIEEGWERIRYYTSHNRVDPNKGEGSEYVYVLENKYMPGLLKIGYTYNDPQIRASQISKSTGVPGEFVVIHSQKCFNGLRVEKAVHEKLKEYRVTSNKEFFKVGIAFVKEVIKSKIEEYG
jgi:hypothetical protein